MLLAWLAVGQRGLSSHTASFMQAVLNLDEVLRDVLAWDMYAVLASEASGGWGQAALQAPLRFADIDVYVKASCRSCDTTLADLTNKTCNRGRCLVGTGRNLWLTLQAFKPLLIEELRAALQQVISTIMHNTLSRVHSCHGTGSKLAMLQPHTAQRCGCLCCRRMSSWQGW
jgi:hypothetical protein